MADIDVERKETSIWPWIIGLLVLLLLAWLLFELLDDDADVAEGPVVEETIVTTPTPAPPTGPMDTVMVAGMDEYLSTCADAPPPETGRQHEFTGDCIRQLAQVMNAVVAGDTVGNVAIQPRLDTFRQHAEAIQESDWQSTQHANRVREVFTSAADLMQTVQEQRYAAASDLQTQISEVRQAAERVTGDTPLLEQSDAVYTFFDETGDVLRGFSQRPAIGV